LLSDLGEVASLLFQLIEGALLAHLTFLQDEHLAAVLDRTQSVSDDNRCTPNHGLVQGVLNKLLVVFVQSRGGLVQHQHSRLADDGPGDGNSLLLAARELASTDSTLGFEAMMEILILESLLSDVDVSFDSLEYSLLFVDHLDHAQSFNLFVELLLADDGHELLLVGSHGVEEGVGLVVELLEVFVVDELLAVRNLRSCLHLAVGSVELAVEDVLKDRVVEDDRFLHHQRHCLSKVVEIVVLHVHTIQKHLSGIDIIEAHEQVNKGALAATRLTDKGHLLVRGNLDAEALQDKVLLASGVAEPYVLELDHSLDLIGVRDSLLRFVFLHLNSVDA